MTVRGNGIPEKWMTVQDAANALDVSIMTVHRWLKTGYMTGVRYVRVAGTIRIDENSFYDWLRSHMR